MMRHHGAGRKDMALVATNALKHATNAQRTKHAAPYKEHASSTNRERFVAGTPCTPLPLCRERSMRCMAWDDTQRCS